MLPPETLPPGDPSGGVVYLRNEILSLVLYNYPIKCHRVPFRVAGSYQYGKGIPLLVLMALQIFGCPVQATQNIRSSYHT